MLNHLTIPSPESGLAARVTGLIDAKTKPPGSLGRIESLAHQIALVQGTETPAAAPARLLLCAGDHGIVAEGVSAWPSDVTAQMVLNFLAGGAAANVFARSAGVEVQVVDAGVAAPLPEDADLIRAGIRAGTRNALVEDALSVEEVEAALSLGADLAARAAADGVRLLLIGEMGIGNTSAATLLVHKVAGIALDDLIGRGAGLDDAGLTRKADVLARAAARRPGPLSPMEALCAFGGLEIAVMAGALIGAAANRIPMLVDGFIATAAALVAIEARPEAGLAAIFAHRSHEAGHRLMLEALEADPLLDLDMRLGEGSGALLAHPLCAAACAMVNEMATFESAGVSGKEG